MANAKHLGREFPYLNNVNMDHRLLGFQAGHNSFVQNTSAGRLDMWSSHMNQAMVLEGATFPRLFSGYEQNLGDYEFSKTERDQDIVVLAVIPKYPMIHGDRNIRKNPSITVIYRGLDDNRIGYMEVDSYTKCSDGFGYENKYLNRHLLDVGQVITKDVKMVTSPIHKDGLYCPGVEAQVAYMTLEDTIEDAMLISRSLADKMTTTEIHRETITIDANQHPLNLYGDETEFKFLPDIGEVVGSHGLLCGFRNVTPESFISDAMPSALNIPQATHDDNYYAAPGSEILDIDFHVAKGAKIQKYLYSQVEKYTYANHNYWQRVLAVYQEYKSKYRLSPAFNTLVTIGIQRLIAAGFSVPGTQRRSKVKLIAKSKRPIDFIQVTITYMSRRACANGFKITAKYGNKGVICRIAEDEDMPTDQNGFRADLVIDPASVGARMNTGQLYEQAINRTSEFVRRQVKEINTMDPGMAWNYLIDYYATINPNYANLVVETKGQQQDRHLADVIKNGIYIHIPPALDTIHMDLIMHLEEKYQIPITPVTFKQRDVDGNITGVFTTKRPVCIGSLYVFLLCKIPDPSSPGVAHVNQYNTPMKPPPSDRLRHPIRRAPIRFGEDEVRIESMDLRDTAEAMRLMCLQANSQKGVDMLVEELLTNPHPTRIKRIPISNEELLNSNTIVLMFRHMMATIGLDSSRRGPFPTRERRIVKDKV